MPTAVLHPGQLRSSLRCLASAFAASSSATALALLPAQLARDADTADEIPDTHPERLALLSTVGVAQVEPAKRKKPVLDVERAVAAATARQTRSKRGIRSAPEYGAPNLTSEHGRSRTREPSEWTTSPTSARTPRTMQAWLPTNVRANLARRATPYCRPNDVGGFTRTVQPFSTTRSSRHMALDRHDDSAMSPSPPYTSPVSSARAFPASPSARTHPFISPAPPRPVPEPEKVEPAAPARPQAHPAGLPGPSSSSQKPIRPPSPYGEINDLARHPLLYDPVLAPRFPIILCHGE